MRNKKGIGLITLIIIIVVILVIGGVILFSVINKNSTNGETSGTSNNSSQKGSGADKKITQLQVEYDRVVALTSNGNMYVVQDQTRSDNYGKGVPAKINTPKLIAKNVKQFFGDGTAYIDSNNNLYRVGVNPIKGGFFDEYVKLGQNIKNVDNTNLGLLATTNDGQLFIYGNSEYYVRF